MQSLGCDVAALNTVQFSRSCSSRRQIPLSSEPVILHRKPGNHTGYGQWTGSKVSAQEIADLYQGLKQSYLDDFDMMLSGYVPGAEALEEVGRIARELQAREGRKPGSFFWVLDPVMGDNGNLYVARDVVPVYRSLAAHADLILPNQFEAEYGPHPFHPAKDKAAKTNHPPDFSPKSKSTTCPPSPTPSKSCTSATAYRTLSSLPSP